MDDLCPCLESFSSKPVPSGWVKARGPFVDMGQGGEYWLFARTDCDMCKGTGVSKIPKIWVACDFSDLRRGLLFSFKPDVVVDKYGEHWKGTVLGWYDGLARRLELKKGECRAYELVETERD